ncbi:MAG: hypothetical protein MSH13_06540 [Ruminococcus callidus]|nr:hypothetical protein [Ruminococcus callidus]
MQVGDCILYGVCELVLLGSPLGQPKGVPCAVLSPQVTEGLFRYSKQAISQGVTLLFFFTEKKKRSKKRKEFAFHLYYKVKYHTKITQETVTTDSHQQKFPGGANRRLLPP